MSASVPYIGSRLSLISKAEIRYEGFLHEIDTTNTTVTLKDVKSFGTETRRTDKVVPPKDDVFQYIIFRGSDIKDISVVESPFSDPAIVQSGPKSGGASRANAPPSQTSNVSAAASPNNAFSTFGMPTTSAQPKPPSQPPAAPSPLIIRESNADLQPSPEPLENSQRQNTSIHDKGQRQNRNTRHFESRDVDHPNRQYAPSRQYNRNFNYSNNYEYDNSRSYSNAAYNGGNNYSGSYRNQSGAAPLMGSNYRGNTNRNVNGPNRWNNGRQVARNGKFSTDGNDNLKLDEEFDIDDANKKFDKDQLIKEMSTLTVDGADEVHVHELNELEDGEISLDKNEAGKFYDKTKSFFDNISCDAMEKKSSRLTNAEEKKLNAQTFGMTSVFRGRGGNSGGYPRNFYNRGRGGNYYGGFGGNNSSQYRRGPGMNNYYTNNYSGQSYSAGAGRRGGNFGQNRSNMFYRNPQSVQS